MDSIFEPTNQVLPLLMPEQRYLVEKSFIIEFVCEIYIKLQTKFYMKNQHPCSTRTPSINISSLQADLKPKQGHLQVANSDGKQDLASSAPQKENENKMAAESTNLSPIERKMLQLRRWKCICSGIGVGGAILQISLVIIQYISCELHPFLLAVLITLPLSLAIVLVGLINHIPLINLQPTASKQQILHNFSTLPRIECAAIRRNAEKTKKLEIASPQKYTGEATVKKLKKLEHIVQNEQKKPSSLKGVILTSALQGLFSLFSGIASLVLQHSLIAIPLSVGCLILMVVSVFCTIKLWQVINKCLPEYHLSEEGKHQQQIQGNSGCEIVLKAGTSTISIDHTLPLKPTTSTLSIDKDIDKETLAQANQIIVDSEILQELDKIQAKKSVLKNAKIRLPKIVRESQVDYEQEGGQRRKVEINSKKIQYFEYSQISPANSAKGDSPVRPQQESKFSNQRMKYYKQRLIEQTLLKRKQLQNKSFNNPNRLGAAKAP